MPKPLYFLDDRRGLREVATVDVKSGPPAHGGIGSGGVNFCIRYGFSRLQRQ